MLVAVKACSIGFHVQRIDAEDRWRRSTLSMGGGAAEVLR
jgi:hypothetical protein